MAKERLVLVDGSAMIFRAFFKLPSSFTTKAGLRTNAIYGFTLMFRKLLAAKTPERAAVVFDAPGKTFRDEQYPAYKAQRPRLPPELKEQLPWIDKVVEAHAFPVLRVFGYEADDVIGTLTRQAVERGMEVQIISGDKDFAQLIGDEVKMIDTLNDVSYDAELVRKKWGVPPAQFVDLLAIMGDKIDNIPGVPGVGQKGAGQLLEQYGSLEGILAHTDELKGKKKELFETHAELARLSKALATIDVHVPLDTDLDALAYTPPDQARLNALYRELEFFSLLSETERDAEAAQDLGATDYRLIEDPAALSAALAKLSDRPLGVHPLYDLPYVVRGEWVGLAISDGPRRAIYAPVNAATKPALAAFLADPTRQKVVHGAKLLMILAAREGMALDGIAGDAQLASFLIDPTGLMPHRLDQIAKQFLQRTVRAEKSVLGSGQSTTRYSDHPPSALADYACHLADALGEAWPIMRRKLEAMGQVEQLFSRDLPLSRVLARMEIAGILVDPESLASMGAEFGERLTGYEKRIYALAGRELNIQSTKQLGELLFDELGLPVIKKTKSGYSTDAEVLEKLEDKHEICGVILEHRKLAKLINTYTDVLQREVNPATGRIHASFQQTVGASGRLITTDPDLQRTPVRTEEGRRIRQAFVAPPGHRLMSADWSQIELRLLAHFTRDERLVDAFRRGLDVHRRTAGEIFGVALEEVTKAQREVGKTVNFATIYGQGATALGQQLKIPRAEAKRYIDEYFERYSGVREWRDRTIAEAHDTGIARTISGRIRIVTELKSNNFVDRQYGERIAVNTPIQGSAADLCKLAMLEIDRALGTAGYAARMLLQVHDELVFEVPEAELEPVRALVKRAMEEALPLEIPLVVDVGVGATWAEAH